MPTTQRTPAPLPSSDEPGIAGPLNVTDHPPYPIPQDAVALVADVDLRLIWRSPTHRGALALDHCQSRQCGEAHPAGIPFYVRGDLAAEFLADMGPRSPYRTTSGSAAGIGRIPGLRRVSEAVEFLQSFLPTPGIETQTEGEN